ncbi:hypothetical protein AGDE_09751 [Angomonas deanei]|nr:hypothetical protein AGDE_09751 [Angomonas deanei]|eukprot:EPY29860.1 hypothetical protein AGDE_09751 [Angomonas deanei]
MSGLDKLVRDIKPDDALKLFEEYMEKVKTTRAKKEEIPRPLYMNFLKYCAARVHIKLQEGKFSQETWLTYCDFFTSAMLSFGTADMEKMLDYSDKVVYSVLVYHSQSQPLLKEYLRCSAAQEEQRSKDLADLRAKDTINITTPVPLDQPPEIERDSHITAVAPAFPVEMVTRVLNRLPEKLSFAHTNGLLHMKLLNPLPIPDCPFVSSGYACDSCGLRGIRVAYEAMLYEEEADTNGVVRSNARIAQHYSHGYDMCTACAVYFYLRQEQHLKQCWMKPHDPFALGVAAGVAVKEASYLNGEAIVTAAKEEFDDAPSHASVSPPSCGPSRKSSQNSSCTSPEPPMTRCKRVSTSFIDIEVGIAPIGSRPIAYVLPKAKELLKEKVDILKTFQPPSDWAERCQTTAVLGTYSSEDKCMVCLESLKGCIPVITTKCGHPFHVECIVGFLRTVSRQESVCPICRAAEPLPDTSLHHALEKNVFKVRVMLTEEEASQKSVRVFVGSAISRSFSYENITSVAAGRCISIKPHEVRKSFEN